MASAVLSELGTMDKLSRHFVPVPDEKSRFVYGGSVLFLTASYGLTQFDRKLGTEQNLMRHLKSDEGATCVYMCGMNSAALALCKC